MTLAERLNWLYEETGYTYDEIESRTEDAGRRVSAGYQSKLRGGTKRNPSYLVVGVLAKAFCIPVVFFSDEIDEEYLAEMEAVLAGDRRAIIDVVLRSLDFSEEERRRIGHFIAQLSSQTAPLQQS